MLDKFGTFSNFDPGPMKIQTRQVYIGPLGVKSIAAILSVYQWFLDKQDKYTMDHGCQIYLSNKKIKIGSKMIFEQNQKNFPEKKRFWNFFLEKKSEKNFGKKILIFFSNSSTYT